MRILFDHSTPRPLRRELIGHSVITSRAAGWHELQNGDLLRVAEDASFDLLLTVDHGIRYQQNLTGRKLAIVVLTGDARWHRVRLCIDQISAAVDAATSGSYTEVFIPFAPRPGSIRNR
jgi:hypothetical protein